MKINLEFLVVSQIVGLFADWVFQWSWQAKNKSKWNREDNWLKSFVAVTSHSILYALITALVSLLLIGSTSKFLLVFIVLFVTHTIIDTRVPVKYILRFKGMSWEEIYDYQNYGFMHIGIDHRLHEMTLLILSLFI